MTSFGVGPKSTIFPESQLGVQFILSIFISLYMFRANMCPSSGEIIVSMGNFVFVTLRGRLSGIPDSHPHRLTNIKCPIDKIISPDDRHIFARNV